MYLKVEHAVLLWIPHWKQIHGSVAVVFSRLFVSAELRIIIVPAVRDVGSDKVEYQCPQWSVAGLL